MNAKLTLRLNAEIKAKAKRYARAQKTSLSKIIEDYLRRLVREKKTGLKVTPLVESLTGVISLPEDYDYKKEYRAYLMQKYS